jgi:hypothetical protein
MRTGILSDGEFQIIVIRAMGPLSRDHRIKIARVDKGLF